MEALLAYAPPRPAPAARETIDLMNIAVVNGDITAGDGFDLMNQMADHDRYLRLPSSPEDLRR